MRLITDSLPVLGLMLWAWCIASAAGAAVLAADASLANVQSTDTDVSTTSTDVSSALATRSPSALLKRFVNFSPSCSNGGLAICVNFHDLYCDDAGNYTPVMSTARDSATSLADVIVVPTKKSATTDYAHPTASPATSIGNSKATGSQ